MARERLSVFLLPEGRAAVRIQPLIDRLAATYAGPVFPAHVTAFAGGFEGTETLVAAVGALAAKTPPVVLRHAGFAIGDTFTKCLFARFEPAHQIAPITEQLRPLALPPATYRLDPHLSLFYGRREVAERAVHEAGGAWDDVTFDRIAVNRSPERSTRPEVVEAWAQILVAPLSGAV